MTDFSCLPVESLVPHRGVVLLLDRIVSMDDDRAVAEADLRPDGLFVRGNAVPAWVGVEYMAQTVAAWAGARARRAGGPVKIGLLLGSRRYEALRPQFPVGACLRIEAECELIGENGLGMFSCRILIGDETVASAKVSVFEPPGGAAFLDNLPKGSSNV